MSDITQGAPVAAPVPRRPPPEVAQGWTAVIRKNYFDSWQNGALTVLIAWALLVTLPRLLKWAVIDAVWRGDAADCHAALGACWAVVEEKWRVMVFGTYPYDQQWRAALTVGLILALAVFTAWRRPRARTATALWLAGMASSLALMAGGVFGLEPVGTYQWSGLPLTLMMFVGTVALGVPLGVVLALGRQSTMPIVKAVCVGFIEIARGLPLVTVLFMASLMIPLFLPQGVTVDKVLRAQVAMTLFFAAYAAEIVRGGLQVIERGQFEAADAIGLTYRQKMTRVILPQVGRVVLPSMMNEVIRAFKNTTFIGIIGLFDVLRATSIALQDPVWVQYSIEAYLFICLLYFGLCFAMSKFSRSVERELNVRRQ
ncbi:amino acid ABC transporter permease [soil metagenome]